MSNRARKNAERGSALLIVFVFAAIVAISLYMEMPVAAFEAERQKEELLIARGNQYARAVQLFVRKTGRYPASLKDLENTNNMRFLRHHYVDPFTGKPDWRLLHAGPGGAIIDSKVKGGMLLPGMAPGQGTQSAGTPTSTASFGSSDTFAKPPQTSAGFGTSAGSSSNDDTQPEVVVQQPKQRPPAVSANGQTGAGSPADASADAALALPPSVPATDTQQQSGNAQNAAAMPNATQGNALPGAPNAPGVATNTAQGGAAQMPDQAGGTTDLKSAMLGAQSGPRLGGGTGSFGSSQMGSVQSGGIAGVASKAGGHSIKLVNDQDEYSKWEFYYDPSKNRVPGGVQTGAFDQQQRAQPQSAFGGQSGSGTQSSFGQPGMGTQSSFGQGGGFGQGSFAQSSNASTNAGNGQAAPSTDTTQNPPAAGANTTAQPKNQNPQ